MSAYARQLVLTAFLAVCAFAIYGFSMTPDAVGGLDSLISLVVFSL